MAPTAFTRYTVAPSTASKKSRCVSLKIMAPCPDQCGILRQTSRSRRKAERKVGSGRKGTVDEEEYLLNSFAKLATRLATAQGSLITYYQPIIYLQAIHSGGRQAFASYASIYRRAPRRGKMATGRDIAPPRRVGPSHRWSLDETWAPSWKSGFIQTAGFDRKDPQARVSRTQVASEAMGDQIIAFFVVVSWVDDTLVYFN